MNDIMIFVLSTGLIGIAIHSSTSEFLRSRLSEAEESRLYTWSGGRGLKRRILKYQLLLPWAPIPPLRAQDRMLFAAAKYSAWLLALGVAGIFLLGLYWMSTNQGMCCMK